MLLGAFLQERNHSSSPKAWKKGSTGFLRIPAGKRNLGMQLEDTCYCVKHSEVAFLILGRRPSPRVSANSLKSGERFVTIRLWVWLCTHMPIPHRWRCSKTFVLLKKIREKIILSVLDKLYFLFRSFTFYFYLNSLTLSHHQLWKKSAILQENGAHTTSPYLRKWREHAEDDIAHSCNFVTTYPILLTTLSCARNEFW